MGESPARWCTVCWQQTLESDRFCQKCGAPVPPGSREAVPTAAGPQAGGSAHPAQEPWAPGPVAHEPLRDPVAAWPPAADHVEWPPGARTGQGAGRDDEDQTQRGSRRLLLVCAAVVVAIAVVVTGIVWSRSGDDTPSSDAASASTSGNTSSTGPSPDEPSLSTTPAPGPSGTWTSDASATAPVTSADGVDGAGNPTTYVADNMLDGDPATTWRMEGDGAGRTLEFDLGTARPISTLGLVNGYAKVDPATGVDRYTQGRRILSVTWSVGGQSFAQDLDDGVRQLQKIDFPPVTASRISLTIDVVTLPGDPAFDRTAISDVLIAND
jgi:hypothetical protein